MKIELQPTRRAERSKMRATETVLFDLGDTLLDDTAAYRSTALRVATYVADRFYVSAHDVAEAYLAKMGQFYQARFWGRALADFGIRDRAFAGWCSFAFEQLHASNLAVIPGVHDMLTQLRRKGVKLGLLTNGLSQTHRRRIVDLGFERSFDAFFLADEIGMIKPDPEIFRYACKRLNTSAEYTVMVGDIYERDIIGASEAGLFTVWVNRERSTLPAAFRQPDATVHRMVDTPLVLPPIQR